MFIKNYNLLSFLKYADPKTILKGRQYFELQKVNNIVIDNYDNKIIIKGICNGYNTSLNIENEKIKKYSCECLYGQSIFCKHLVALIYAANLEKNKQIEFLYGINIKEELTSLDEKTKHLFILIINNMHLLSIKKERFLTSFKIDQKINFELNQIDEILSFLEKIIDKNEKNNDLNFLIEKIKKLNEFFIFLAQNKNKNDDIIIFLINNFFWIKDLVEISINDEYIDDLEYTNKQLKINFNFILDNNQTNINLFWDQSLKFIYYFEKSKLLLVKNNNHFYIYKSEFKTNKLLNDFNFNHLITLIMNSNNNKITFNLQGLMLFRTACNLDQLFKTNLDEIIKNIFSVETIKFDLNKDKFEVIFECLDHNNYQFLVDIILNIIWDSGVFVIQQDVIKVNKHHDKFKLIIQISFHFWFIQIYNYFIFLEKNHYFNFINIYIDPKFLEDYENKKTNNDFVEIKQIKDNKFQLNFKQNNHILEENLVKKINQQICSSHNEYFKFKNKIYNINEFKNIVNFLKKVNFNNNFFQNEIIYFFYYANLLNYKQAQSFVNWFNKYHLSLNINSSLLNQLKPYQLDGVKWLKKMLTLTNGCILADEMGLGKTLQTISLINDEMFLKKTILIISPSTVCNVWENEFLKFNDQKIINIDGTVNDRICKINNIKNNIYITSYNKLLKDINYYQNINFDLVVLDEGHFIKNKNAKWSKYIKSLKANYRLIISGTPIENNLNEIWSLFDFILPNYLPNLKEFNSYFKNHLDELSLVIKPFILQRTKSKELKELPKKNQQTIFVELNEDEQTIYDKLNQNVIGEIKTFLDTNDNKLKLNILALITKLRLFVCDPSLLKYPNLSNSKFDACLKLINKIITRDNKNKIVIFSNFSSVLKAYALKLKANNINNLIFTGENNQKERIEIINDFKNKNINVLLISLKSGGFGINLSFANNVIHLNPWWNNSAENQATDRLHRIGQLKDVNIYKLISKDTIEEYVLSIKKNKDKLIKKTINSKDYLELFKIIINHKDKSL